MVPVPRRIQPDIRYSRLWDAPSWKQRLIIRLRGRCAICGGRLDRPYLVALGPSHVPDKNASVEAMFQMFMFPPELPHALRKFCGAPLHFDCLETWTDHREFSEAWYADVVKWHGETTSAMLYPSDRFALVAGPSSLGSRPLYAEVLFRDWPFQLYTEWKSWNGFVGGGFSKGLGGGALRAAEAAMNTVRSRAPDLDTLERLHREFQESAAWMAAWEGILKGEREAEQRKREAEQSMLARSEMLVVHNEACDQLAQQLQRSELTCPRCGRRSMDFELVDRAPQAASVLVCRQCGRSFGPEDVPDSARTS